MRDKLISSLESAYTQFNEIVTFEGNILDSKQFPKDFKKYIALYKSDCRVLADLILQEIPTIHGEPTELGSSPELFRTLPIYWHHYKAERHRLHNSVLIKKDKIDDSTPIIKIIIKSRVLRKNYYQTSHLTHAGSEKRIKPYGLMIDLSLTGNILGFNRIVTWSTSPAYTSLERTNTAIQRKAKSQSLAKLEESASKDGFHKAAWVESDRTGPYIALIYYQKYLGISLKTFLQSYARMEKNRVRSPIFLKNKEILKAEMIFGYLNEIKNIFIKGIWPSDLKLKNTCIIINPVLDPLTQKYTDYNIKISIIDYQGNGTTFTKFKRDHGKLSYYFSLLERMRDETLRRLLSLKDFIDLMDQLIFETIHMIMIMFNWPEVERYLPFLHSSPLNNNQLIKPDDTIITIPENQKQLWDIFYAVGPHRSNQEAFQQMLYSILRQNKPLFESLGFTSQWINEFVNLANNFSNVSNEIRNKETIKIILPSILKQVHQILETIHELNKLNRVFIRIPLSVDIDQKFIIIQKNINLLLNISSTMIPEISSFRYIYGGLLKYFLTHTLNHSHRALIEHIANLKSEVDSLKELFMHEVYFKSAKDIHIDTKLVEFFQTMDNIFVITQNISTSKTLLEEIADSEIPEPIEAS